jgi:hypothetical protein
LHWCKFKRQQNNPKSIISSCLPSIFFLWMLHQLNTTKQFQIYINIFFLVNLKLFFSKMMQHSQKKLIWRKSAGYDRLGIIFVCLLTLHQYSRLIYGTCNIQNIMNCQFNSFVSNVFIFEKKTPNIYIDQKVLQLNKASFWKNLARLEDKQI